MAEEDRKPIEFWAAVKGTPAWIQAATRAYKCWGLGQEVSEEDYDAASYEAANVPIGQSDRYDVSSGAR